MVKQIIHAAGDCGGQYQVLHTDQNIPFLSCVKCGHKIEDWIKWTDTYCKYWEDNSKWLNKRNHPVCILGYFTHLYKTHYGVEFALSLNERGLFKGVEIVQIRKLLSSFDGDASLCKQFIDWMFSIKVGLKKKKITSLGFLTNTTCINEFNLLRHKHRQINRSTVLPNGMINWLRTFAHELTEKVALKDFGDLHTFLTHYRGGFLREDAYAARFVERLKSSGVVSDDLKIKNWAE